MHVDTISDLQDYVAIEFRRIADESVLDSRAARMCDETLKHHVAEIRLSSPQGPAPLTVALESSPDASMGFYLERLDEVSYEMFRNCANENMDAAELYAEEYADLSDALLGRYLEWNEVINP